MHTLKHRGVNLLKMAAVAFVSIFMNDTAFIADLFGSLNLVAIPSLVAVAVEGLAWIIERIKS